MSEPVYKFRVVRKNLKLEDAQTLIAQLKEQHPDRDYRIVLLDGAVNAWSPYRIVMLRNV